MSVEPPRGFFPGRVDEKGRLKLPSVFQQYLASLGERMLFVTSLDGSTVRLYISSTWKENEKLFAKAQEQEIAEDLAFLAGDAGANSEIDGQGRILIPQELRRELQLENQLVHLGYYNGGIDVFTDSVYAQRKQRALENRTEKLRLMKQLGLK
jgi:transcriptional regulator MraZ